MLYAQDGKKKGRVTQDSPAAPAPPRPSPHVDGDHNMQMPKCYKANDTAAFREISSPVSSIVHTFTQSDCIPML